jgi:putative ABC transport system permease protein
MCWPLWGVKAVTVNKLVFKNIRRRLSDYAMYLASSGFIVAVFYIFASLFYSDQFVFLQKISENMQTGFRIAAILVFLYGAAFIWYSTTFFVKNRKKEIATYLLMGFGKSQVTRMLFLEIMAVGLIGLGLGLAAGVLFSKYVGMLLVNVTKNIAEVKFTLAPKAIGMSILVFVALYLVNALHVSSLVYRTKLIDLYQADKKAEKRPRGSWIMGIFGLGLLIYGYVESALMTVPVNASALLRVTLVVAVGTFLTMASLLILLLRLASRNKKRYWGGPRLIAISQLMYRIKGQAVTLAAIAVLNAMTITAVAAVWSIYSSSAKDAKYYMPFDITYVTDGPRDGTLDTAVDDMMASYEEEPAYDVTLAMPRVRIQSGGRAYVVSESQFNATAAAQGSGRAVSLAQGEAVYTDSAYYDKLYKELPRYDAIQLTAGEASFHLAVTGHRKDRIVNQQSIKTVIVVSDADYPAIVSAAGADILYLRGMMLADPFAAEAMIQELDHLVPGPDYFTQQPSEGEDREFESYLFKYQDEFMSIGLFLFVELFHGVLFLMALGSILYYKQLSESRFDAPRYRILTRVGMDRSEIRRSVGLQLGIVFGIPLVIGIIHSTFAIRILDMVWPQSQWGAYAFVVGVYTLLYTLYYLATWRQYVSRVTAEPGK